MKDKQSTVTKSHIRDYKLLTIWFCESDVYMGVKVLLTTWFGAQIHETLVLQNLVHCAKLSIWITNKPGRELVRYRSHVKGSCNSDSLESVEGEEGIRPFLWRKSWSIASVLEIKLVLYKEIFPWKILNPSG